MLHCHRQLPGTSCKALPGGSMLAELHFKEELE